MSPKCPFLRRKYPPGFQGKNRRRRYLSEYGKQLREKQKLRNFYNLSEGKFHKYVKEALEQRGEDKNSREILIRKLETRLDNVVYRLGLADSRPQARQLVKHGHFRINGRKTDIPSAAVRRGDIISVKPSSRDKNIFSGLTVKLKNYNVPSWLKLSPENMEGEVVGEPSLEEASAVGDVFTIFEYYSR